MTKDLRKTVLAGLLQAFGTGYVSGEPETKRHRKDCKPGLDSKTRRKRRKKQRQARKQGRNR